MANMWAQASRAWDEVGLRGSRWERAATAGPNGRRRDVRSTWPPRSAWPREADQHRPDAVLFGTVPLVRPAWLLFLPPRVAIGSAAFFYERRRVPVVVYVFALVVYGAIAGYLGVFLGARWACSGPHPGNQCFLMGVFVVGPICGALAMFIVGLAFSRPRRK